MANPPASDPIGGLIEPTLPQHFTPELNETIPGVYIVGHDKFETDNYHIVDLARRQLTSADEYILGLLSVLLIAVLTEIVHVVLLRTAVSADRDRHVSPHRLMSAFFFSQITHFRNIFRHISASSASKPSSRERHSVQSDPSISAPTDRENGAEHVVSVPSVTLTLSIALLLLGICIFVVDVVVIMLTQPRTKLSTFEQYNLRGVHPIIADQGLALYISRMVVDRPCVSPYMAKRAQTRRFLLYVCADLSERTGGLETSEIAKDISIQSFFHIAGADHNVTFGPWWFSIRVRVDLLLSEEEGGKRHLLFQSLDSGSFAHTRYIHQVVVHRGKEKACNKTWDAPLTKFCGSMSNSTEPTSWAPVKRQVTLWPNKTEEVVGVESLFKNINMPGPYLTLKRGVALLLPSLAIYETTGPARYSLSQNDSLEENAIEHLLAEGERVAGVASLAGVSVLFILILLCLRLWLQPVSLGSVAVTKVDEAYQRILIVEKQVGAGAGDGTELSYEEPLAAESNVIGAAGPIHEPHHLRPLVQTPR